MKLYKILSNPIFQFPVTRSNYFPAHLSDIFRQYLNLLSQVNDEYADVVAENFGYAEQACEDILRITVSILEGKTISAYEQVNVLMKRIQNFLVHPNSKNVVDMNNTHYFKARDSHGLHMVREDMFHIPFEKRHTIRTNRFSVPGLPCLYLSESIYTCWEELDRPSLNHMYVSRFTEHRINLKYLDLIPRYEYIKEVLNPSTQKRLGSVPSTVPLILPSSIVLFPLLVGCYTHVKNNTDIFKPEYIFPQLLMQWVLTQEYLHGIKYLSTKGKSGEHSFFDTPVNYAIPVREISEEGYCKFLSSHLKLTDPISWELYTINNPLIKIPEKSSNDHGISKRLTYNLNGTDYRWYGHSAFGLLERELEKMPFKLIKQQPFE